ncbi:PepSY-associated TM helix domain-containing protein [Thermomonospora cellulosilytica]|uniref:Putative iron-regulated membrane protein n=1 Tax=Thermomonospora cellulosilytica TaxID=1411118 RepID=A0A7W3RCY8_9ACTN|nr:PepSY domain-containing protein [Thermomonospora cellulosilytica]MBA9007785.1 putative iron-regulated membrane protein [Thermomonospora cellulosilytica]
MHFYAGVFVAPFLLLAALTGLLYAFSPQLEQIVHRDVLHAERVAGNPLPLAEQVRAARTAHPEGMIKTVVPPDAPEETTRVVLNGVPGLGELQRTVYVDPYTGKVLGARTTEGTSMPVTTWLGELHRSLHLGDTGALYAEAAASWLWVIAVLGLLMWVVRRRHYRGTAPVHRALWHDRSARGVRRTRGRHGALGLWAATGLLVVSITGLTWTDHAGARFDLLQERLNSTPPKLDTSLTGAPAGGAPAAGHGGHAHHGGAHSSAHDPDPVQIDKVLATARTAGITGPVEISPPARPGHAWTVAETDNTWPVRKDKAAVDPAAQRVTDRVAFSDHPTMAKLTTLGIQFHMGRLFGPANQLFMAATALGLIVLVFWAYRMWWQRRPTRADRRAPFGRPPARGAWRSLPTWTLIAGVPLMLAVAWAVPVLGVTLLAFLVIDALVGVLRRPRTS